MTIDIVDYPDEVYEVLNSQQYYKVQYAQHRKNALLEELEEETQKAKQALIQKGTYVSELFAKTQAKLREKYETKIDLVKKELIAYLGNTMRPGHTHDFEAPYVLNYALSQYQRYKLVKKYYTEAYPNATERLNAFKNDVLAMTYIEEYYETLYTFFGTAV